MLAVGYRRTLFPSKTKSISCSLSEVEVWDIKAEKNKHQNRKKTNNNKIKNMTKKLLITLSIFALFANGTKASDNNSATHDEGVVINGVRWATRNVDMPGTFAETPESFGMLFQWNRKKGWSATDREVANWDRTNAKGARWEKENDPCPEGWRVPIYRELDYLLRADSEWVIQNGVNGRLFGTVPNQIFLPAVGWRPANDGRLAGMNTHGTYWGNENINNTIICDAAWHLGFDNIGNRNRMHIGFYIWRANAASVRCVAK